MSFRADSGQARGGTPGPGPTPSPALPAPRPQDLPPPHCGLEGGGFPGN